MIHRVARLRVRVGLSMACLGACSYAPVAQQLPEQPSLRGLSALDGTTAWVSGSANQVARSLDGGQSWHAIAVLPPDTPPLDFRDLEVLSATEIVLMAAGPGRNSKIFRTSDGGNSWQVQAVNENPEGFWDGIAFWNADRGILVGDPVDGKLTILRTFNGGRTWAPVHPGGLPDAVEGEYAFAASGTSVAVAGDSSAWIATGGSVARVYRSTDGGDSWQIVKTPMSAGTAGSGIFSISFRDTLHGVMVGGDYEKPEQVLTIAAWTDDGGLHWRAAEAMPGGYRSGVSWHPRRGQWIAVGPTGVDISSDGQSWQPMVPALSGYHSVDGNWMSGAEGRVAHLY